MSKKLNDLENIIPEELYLKAEKLLIDKRLKEKFSEKNLYTFIVEDNGKWEVEILISPTYIKSYSCSCETYANQQLCPHVSAALLFLRTKLSKAKSQSKPVVKKVKSLNLDAIFDNINPTDIRAFIKSYARSDMKFDLAMKINFARRVTLEDDTNKYSDLLDRLLKPLANQFDTYNQSTINFYLKNAHEFFEQYRDAFSLKSYVEAIELLAVLLKKTIYAKAHLRDENQNLTSFHEKLEKEVISLLQQELAPELRDKFYILLLDLVELSFYPIDFTENKLIRTILDIGTKKELESLFKSLTARQEFTENKEFIDLLTFKTLLLNQINKPIIPIIAEVKLFQLQDFFKNLFLEEEFELINEVIKISQQKQQLRTFNFNDIEILLARRKNDQQKLISGLSDKYKKSHNDETLNELLSFDLDYVKNTLDKIYLSIVHEEKRALQIIKILFKLKQYDILIDYIFKVNAYEAMTEMINEILLADSNLIEFYVRKYMEKCKIDPFHAHRNQIYLIRNMDAIFDDAISSKYLNQLRAFKEVLDEDE